MDGKFVDKIVNEVKIQGVFDQFRRESINDCDTKPAYQNLKQRVESSVTGFLDYQKWRPDMNKNQIREKLRKHIHDGGFLEIGVQHIVDQVVLPKISTVFQPKIEDIVYKYLGIPLIKVDEKFEDSKPFTEEQYLNVNFTPNGNLAVKTNFLPTEDLEAISPDSDKSTIKSDSIKVEAEEDDESPPFEPIRESPSKPMKNNDTNSLSCDLTSQSQDGKPEIKNEFKPEEEKHLCGGAENTQESLSQVSSNSRLSIDEENEHKSPKKEIEKPKVDISEEAQMPKFLENSNSCPSVSTESLHFDIKKDEIKFEGTDRNTDYKSLKSDDLTNSPLPPPPLEPEPNEVIPPPPNVPPPPEIPPPPEVPPPPSPDTILPPLPPSEKTDESCYYDDDSEKPLQIVEESQTKDNEEISQEMSVENNNSAPPQLLSPSTQHSGDLKNKDNKSNTPSPFSINNKDSKDKKNERDREKNKNDSKNSTPESKKSEKCMSNRFSKDYQKSRSHHKDNKNDKFTNNNKDKSKSERDKKREKYRTDKISDDHSSSRSKSRNHRKSTDSEDGPTDKRDSNNSLSTDRSNNSKRSKGSNRDKHKSDSKTSSDNHSKLKSKEILESSNNTLTATIETQQLSQYTETTNKNSENKNNNIPTEFSNELASKEDPDNKDNVSFDKYNKNKAEEFGKVEKIEECNEAFNEKNEIKKEFSKIDGGIGVPEIKHFKKKENEKLDNKAQAGTSAESPSISKDIDFEDDVKYLTMTPKEEYYFENLKKTYEIILNQIKASNTQAGKKSSISKRITQKRTRNEICEGNEQKKKNQSLLTVDCSEDENKKRMKISPSKNLEKISPTPSEISSKENDFIDKISNKKEIDEKLKLSRNTPKNKIEKNDFIQNNEICNPKSVLSPRTRRRGLKMNGDM